MKSADASWNQFGRGNKETQSGTGRLRYQTLMTIVDSDGIVLDFDTCCGFFPLYHVKYKCFSQQKELTVASS